MASSACPKACSRRSGAEHSWCCTASAPTAKARPCCSRRGSQASSAMSRCASTCAAAARARASSAASSASNRSKIWAMRSISSPASRGRSRPHRRHRFELRRRGRGLCRRHQSAPRRGHLQRRLGPWRTQIPRPASDAAGLGEIHQNARRRPRPPRPHRQIADGAALRHRADPRPCARKPGAAARRHAGAQFGGDVSGRDRAEHVRLPRRGGGGKDRAAPAAARSTPPTIW